MVLGTRTLVGGGGAVLGAALLCACPIPDRDIRVVTEDVNEHAVKLIEPVGISRGQACECQPNVTGCKPDDDPDDFAATCPQPLSSGLPHFMDPVLPQYQFCVCGEDQFDAGASPPVEFFAEDQDTDPETGNPKDQLFAVLLLNSDFEGNPENEIAYVGLRPPTSPLPEDPGSYQVSGRPNPIVRRILVTDENGRWDLCNQADVKQGFNTFTLLVTDKPWNEVPVDIDDDDEPDELLPQLGVPDIASGATYDTSTYTFYCSSDNDPINPVSPGGDGNDPFACADRCTDFEEPGG